MLVKCPGNAARPSACSRGKASSRPLRQFTQSLRKQIPSFARIRVEFMKEAFLAIRQSELVNLPETRLDVERRASLGVLLAARSRSSLLMLVSMYTSKIVTTDAILRVNSAPVAFVPSESSVHSFVSISNGELQGQPYEASRRPGDR